MNNNFNETVESLFKGMDGFITTKTVVGDAVSFEDGTIILPLVEVSFAVGAGVNSAEKKNNAGGGLGGKITPNSVLVIQEGSSKLLNVKGQDGVGKVIDMVPDIVNKFSEFMDKGKKDKASSDPELDKKVEKVLKDKK